MSLQRIDRLPLLALFQKRIAGDDALLELARLRFRQSRMGAEMYAASLNELEWMWQFKPSRYAPTLVHLPRDLDVLQEPCRDLILAMCRRFAGRIIGFVVHDQSEINDRLDDYIWALGELNARMEQIEGCPLLFIEYAIGLAPELYLEVHQRLNEMPRISACVDVSHVGILQIREAYAKTHPGEDVCALKDAGQEIEEVIDEVQEVTKTALPVVVRLIEELAALGKPLHFHLHDGHPLSRFSPFGVPDHLSFLAKIPINCEFRGDRFVAPIFGPEGLSKIIASALEQEGSETYSFAIEVHETGERLSLGNADFLFPHWRDTTNAEKMNHWLSVLQENHKLLREAVQQAAG